jgi:predicted Ser/Thr protein kinase
MGEVFRARDTRLDRTVAIKICTGHFTERFEREARAISSLNHPHICALYDIGREGTVEFLVMEYIEGESLEARLRKGPLPIEEALQIAIQIAGALDAAHRRGMVHRDLKPGNVMLTKGGAKLLDFGLAKMNEPAGISDTDVTQLAPHRPITVQGTILGTLQYMSPEQLEGKEADARSDIFSFGAMLYEMITGRKGFAGSSQATLIVAVMSVNPPPVSTLQPMVSPALDRVVRKCLAKSPEERWQNAGDLYSELEWIAETGAEVGVPSPVAAKRRGRERMAWLAAGVAAVMLIASLAWIAFHPRTEPAPPAMVQFQIPVPDKLSFFWYQRPAVSPDGERIVFAASETSGSDDSKLFVRPLNAATATEIPIPGSISRLSLLVAGRTADRILIRRNPPESGSFGGTARHHLCVCNAVTGGTWNRDGVILSTNKATGVLFRVSAAGGDAKPIRPLAQGETSQRSPEFLPDGKHYLYTSFGNAPNQPGIYAASLDSNDRTFLVATNTPAAYLQSGQLLFTRGNVLMAQSFDLQSLKLSGGTASSRRPHRAGDDYPERHLCSLSQRRGGVAPRQTIFAVFPAVVRSQRQETRHRRRARGLLQPRPLPRRQQTGCLHPRSADKDARYLDLRSAARWKDAADLRSRRRYRPHLVAGRNPDRLHVGPFGAEKYLLETGGRLRPGRATAGGGKEGQENVEDWSTDGKYLIYNYIAGTAMRLSGLPLAGDRKPVTYLDTGFNTQESQFSPDGRWVAYTPRNPEGRRSMCRGSRWIRRSRAANGRSPRNGRRAAPMAPRRQRALLPLRHAVLCRGREDGWFVLRGRDSQTTL